MTAFSLVMLSLSLFFFFFLIIKTVCLHCSYFTTETLARGGIDIFRSLRQISTRCSSAKALSFLEERNVAQAESRRHNAIVCQF